MTTDDRMVACRFVLDHCGGHHQLTPSSPTSMREAWRDGISHLGPISNVYCKLSGLLGAQGGAEGGGGGVVGWSPDAQRETVRHGLTACLPICPICPNYPNYPTQYGGASLRAALLCVPLS